MTESKRPRTGRLEDEEVRDFLRRIENLSSCEDSGGGPAISIQCRAAILGFTRPSRGNVPQRTARVRLIHAWPACQIGSAGPSAAHSNWQACTARPQTNIDPTWKLSRAAQQLRSMQPWWSSADCLMAQVPTSAHGEGHSVVLIRALQWLHPTHHHGAVFPLRGGGALTQTRGV
jgi:hypothetical protein